MEHRTAITKKMGKPMNQTIINGEDPEYVVGKTYPEEKDTILYIHKSDEPLRNPKEPEKLDW